MRICFITSRYPPDRGGMAVSAKRIVAGLKDRGFRVHVVHLCQWPERIRNLIKKGSQIELSQCPVTMTVTGVNGPSTPQDLFWSLKHILENSLIIGFGGDIPGFLATLWSKWLCSPCLVLFRGNDLEKGIYKEQGWKVVFALEKSDVVGCVSKEMTRRVANLRKGPTVYIPNGIDPDEWTIFDKDLEAATEWRLSQSLSDMAVISVFGQLKDKKGLSLLIELIRSSNLRHRAKLLTVGDITEDLFSSALSISDSWIHVPYVKRNLLPRLYCASDVIVIPSKYDGMPNVLLEAMALERIVVASRSGGMPDVIEHGKNGFLFDPFDLEGAYKVLNAAVTLEEHEKKMIGKGARATILKKFTNNHEINRLEDVIKNLLV